MRARVVWLVLCGIWGSTWLFIKLGLRDLPPVSFAGMRFVIASAILFGVAAVRRSRLPRAGRDWAMIAATGVLAFTVNYGLLFWGEQHVSSGLAAILQAMIPAFGLVIAHYLLPSERITPPSLVSRNWNGLPGTVTIACWSGWSPLGCSESVPSKVISVPLRPASVERTTPRLFATVWP